MLHHDRPQPHVRPMLSPMAKDGDDQLDDRLSKILGRNVRRLRRAMAPKMSQERLAALANVSRSTVAQLEGGRYKGARVSTVLQLARGLRTSPSALLHGAGSEDTQVIDAFLDSGEARALAPADEEVAWLRDLPAIFWADIPPTTETVALILRLRRRTEARAGAPTRPRRRSRPTH